MLLLNMPMPACPCLNNGQSNVHVDKKVLSWLMFGLGMIQPWLKLHGKALVSYLVRPQLTEYQEDYISE